MEKKPARDGVFFNTDVMRRSRMQLAFLEHTRVRTVREIFASSGCKSAGELRFSGIKMYSGECRFKYAISAVLEKREKTYSWLET